MIVAIIKEEEEGVDPSSPTRKRKRRPHGKIGFESLAKTIGRRWQELGKEEATYYKDKAAEDMAKSETSGPKWTLWDDIRR